MAQGNSNLNTANIRPARPSDKPPSNRRWRNMAERYQRAIGQDNNSQAHPQIGMDAGKCKNAQLAEEKVTTQETAELNGTMNFVAPGAIETITATTLAE